MLRYTFISFMEKKKVKITHSHFLGLCRFLYLVASQGPEVLFLEMLKRWVDICESWYSLLLGKGCNVQDMYERNTVHTSYTSVFHGPQHYSVTYEKPEQ